MRNLGKIGHHLVNIRAHPFPHDQTQACTKLPLSCLHQILCVMMNGYVSPASSSPPSPLPISVGPGNKNYSFLPSPASSPPTSGHASAENLPLLSTPQQVTSAFSLDRPKASDEPEDRSWNGWCKDAAVDA
ncbi:hypothetical protein GQ457_07G033070 [Hibiscus cannabinus]